MLAEVVDGEDVGMVQRGGCAGLLLEPMEALRVGRKRRGEHLDGDVPAEAWVTRPIDLAHAAGPNGREDLVRAEAGAGL